MQQDSQENAAAAAEGAVDAAAAAQKATSAGAAGAVAAALAGEKLTPAGLWTSMGGTRGVVESMLPSLLYIVLFVWLRDARLACIAPLALSVLFVLIRLVRRETVQGAVSGLLVGGVCVVLTLFTGKGESYFLPGLWTNIAWASAYALSLLVRWPLIGFLIGFFRGSITAWRKDRAVRRAADVASFAWLLLFAGRIAIKLPLYLAAERGSAAAVDALGIATLVLGLPAFALAVFFTWLVIRKYLGGNAETAGQAASGMSS